uniref:ATP synthase subunit a n=1 Tax=Cryptocellus narino TaxID=1329480 RepID=W5R4K8_9ARAC|nr:ATP synthase F0 subunit 6 [Cryptocellus narino]AGL11923.1 ATP synthase F0 subunit 6 [Cryptocellus narino]
MMINLFSTFDPATSSLTSLNWISLILPISMMPLSLWSMSSQQQTILKMMSSKINQEIVSMNIKMPKGSLILTFSIFWFIMISNTLGLMPYTFTSTSHLTISLTLALTAWISLNLYGWLKNSNHMMTHTLPMGTPSALMPFMVCIETISNIIRPITLSVRLTANMIAGHLLICLISNTMMNSSFIMCTPIMMAEFMLMLLETAVAFIQSYVFMTLLTLYLDETN